MNEETRAVLVWAGGIAIAVIGALIGWVKTSYDRSLAAQEKLGREAIANQATAHKEALMGQGAAHREAMQALSVRFDYQQGKADDLERRLRELESHGGNVIKSLREDLKSERHELKQEVAAIHASQQRMSEIVMQLSSQITQLTSQLSMSFRENGSFGRPTTNPGGK